MLGLEYVCKLYDISYLNLANKLEVTSQQINDWIKLRRRIPQHHLENASKILGIPSAYLEKELDDIDGIRIQEIKIKREKERYFSMTKGQKRVCIINYKGGVGKTTLALNLAAGLSTKGKVLLIDVDHQANLSRACLKSKEFTEDNSVAAIFKSYINRTQMPDTQIIEKAPLKRFKNLDILPSIEELDEFEFDLASTAHADDFHDWDKKTLICKWIDDNNLESEYDYIVFDCPPATMNITQNALAASHFYIVPLIPSELSLRGLNHLIHMIDNKIYSKLLAYKQMLEIGIQNGLYKNCIYKSFVGHIELKAAVLSMVQVAPNTYNRYGCTDVHQRGIDQLKQWEKSMDGLKGKVLYDHIVYKRTDIENAMGLGMPAYNTEYDNQGEITELVDYIAKIL